MKNKCENCIYFQLVRDMGGGGYYVCNNRNYNSWPEVKDNCPHFELKSNIKNKTNREDKNE